MFDNQTLYLTAKCYNILKSNKLLVDNPNTGQTFFIGFTTGTGISQNVPVKVMPAAQLPAGHEMIMSNQGVPHV
jgi:hypothetical protein